MQRVDEFMTTFFRARTHDEQEYQKTRAPFRAKFFAQNCRFDSHADTLQRMESEKIVSIIDGDKSEANVITEQTFHYSAGVKPIRHRYHLGLLNGAWLIENVQTACVICDGKGDNSCPGCKGKQWR
jgi:hypothetical protein